MKNPYYMLISDTLCRSKEYYPQKKDQHIRVISHISVLECFNFVTILAFCTILNGMKPLFEMPKILDAPLLTALLVYFLPFFLFNYFLLIRNNKYKKIMEKYGKAKYNYFLIYGFITSILIAFAEVWSVILRLKMPDRTDKFGLIYFAVIAVLAPIGVIIIMFIAKKKKDK